MNSMVNFVSISHQNDYLMIISRVNRFLTRGIDKKISSLRLLKKITKLKRWSMYIFICTFLASLSSENSRNSDYIRRAKWRLIAPGMK